MPFCPICFRFLTDAEAKKHTQHKRVIIDKKKEGKK